MKSFICIITSVILAVSSFCINVSATQKVEISDSYRVFDIWQGEGDVDCNGKISANDARMTLRASVDLENLSTEQYLAADIDNDSLITASDARTLLRVSVGLEKFEQIK